MIVGDVLESVGPEYGANGVEQGVEVVLGLAGVELTFVAVCMVKCFEQRLCSIKACFFFPLWPPSK